jgi:RimK family alpha-L-glutamate ligase
MCDDAGMVALLRLAVVAWPMSAYGPRRLAEEARARGCIAVPVDARAFSAARVDGRLQPCQSGIPLRVDGAVHVMSTDFPGGLSALADLGPTLPHLNSSAACLRSADKFSTYLALRAAGVPTPATRRCADDGDLISAADSFGWPLVVKQADGSGGWEVGLALDADDLHRQLPQLRRRGQVLLAQQYVGTSRGTDLRIVVVGGRVITAGRRVSAGDFRSNLAQGGHGEIAVPSSGEAAVAVAAASAVGLDVAGVDVLTAPGGPLVLETNSFPGLYDIEPLTGINVAAKIIELLVRRCAPPPLHDRPWVRG